MEFGSGCCIKGRMPNRGGPLSGMPYGLLPTARGSVFCPVFGLPFLPNLLLPQQVVVALLSLGPLRRFHAVARCGGGGGGRGGVVGLQIVMPPPWPPVDGDRFHLPLVSSLHNGQMAMTATQPCCCCCYYYYYVSP